MIWLYWLLYVLLLVLQLAGLFINVVNLPGLWVMLLALLSYKLATGREFIGWNPVIALTAIAAIAELIDTLAASAGAKRAGSSKKGMLGALVGAIVGGILFQGLIPIPIVGAIIGVLLGCFLGAGLVELAGGKKVAHSARIGAHAAGGKLIGILTKLAFGVIIFLTTCVLAFPMKRSPSAAPTGLIPSTPATSVPATTLPATRRGV